MANPISGLPPQFTPGMLPPMPAAAPQVGGAPSGMPGFQDLLLGAVSNVNNMEASAQDGIRELLTGGDITQAEALSEIKKAELSLRTLLQVRNKMLEAYREIINLRM